jgi:NAD(P)H-dependent FMN reductase
MPNLLVVNGSLGGKAGNTAAVVDLIIKRLNHCCRVETLHLAEQNSSFEELERSLRRADGFLLATGTYWDSWGSPLQRFFEQTTHWEGSEIWLGKPAAVVVTMHSVGGKGVLSRIQGLLSSLGCLIPPMTGLPYSLACHIALTETSNQDCADEFWQLDDCEALAHNLLEALHGGRDWKVWAVDRRSPGRWMPQEDSRYETIAPSGQRT